MVGWLGASFVVFPKHGTSSCLVVDESCAHRVLHFDWGSEGKSEGRECRVWRVSIAVRWVPVTSIPVLVVAIFGELS